MAHDELAAAKMARERGKIAAGIKDPERRRDFISHQGRMETEGRENLAELGEENFREQNRQEAEKALGSMKYGGVIKKTGVYKLHQGERVVPASKLRKSNGEEVDTERN